MLEKFVFFLVIGKPLALSLGSSVGTKEKAMTWKRNRRQMVDGVLFHFSLCLT